VVARSTATEKHPTGTSREYDSTSPTMRYLNTHTAVLVASTFGQCPDISPVSIIHYNFIWFYLRNNIAWQYHSRWGCFEGPHCDGEICLCQNALRISRSGKREQSRRVGVIWNASEANTLSDPNICNKIYNKLHIVGYDIFHKIVKYSEIFCCWKIHFFFIHICLNCLLLYL
jgi:hypothetical protein